MSYAEIEISKRNSLIIVIAGVLYTPGQTDLNRTGIQSILVNTILQIDNGDWHPVTLQMQMI